MICILAISKVSVTEQAGLYLTCSKIPEDTFSRDMAHFILTFNSPLLLIHLHTSMHLSLRASLIGPRQANLVLIAYASSEGSGEPAHPRSLARTSAARSYKQ